MLSPVMVMLLSVMYILSIRASWNPSAPISTSNIDEHASSNFGGTGCVLLTSNVTFMYCVVTPYVVRGYIGAMLIYPLFVFCCYFASQAIAVSLTRLRFPF